MNTCKYCKVETTNPSFCSRSCASSFNNSLKPKRKSNKKCQACEISISYRKTYCESCKSRGCHKTSHGILTEDTTLRQVIYLKHHKSSAFALVRTRARAEAKRHGMTFCSVCGYNKHVEISHKKAIAKFDLDTLISIINAPSNLWPLCPNCHWEYDNNNTPSRNCT